MNKKEQEELIEHISNKMTDVWSKEIPEDMMKTAASTHIMYNSSLFTYFRIANILGLSLEDCYRDLEKYYEQSKSSIDLGTSKNDLN